MTGTYCKNEYKLIRKQCMMVLWILIVHLLAERACAPELILNAKLPVFTNTRFSSRSDCSCAFSSPPLSLSVSPAVPYHSPVELTTEPTVSLSFMAGVMKH